MDDKLTMTPTEALLREAQALERLTAIYAEIRRRGGASVEVPPGRGADAQAMTDITKLSLTDAILLDLKASKKPKTPQQIWQSLEKQGYESNSSAPEASVRWALKKLLVQGGDIVRVGVNQWNLRSRYTKAALERLLAKGAGRGGRTTDEHVARTLAGIEKAKAAGKPWHRPSKINAENVGTFKRMLVAGASVREIAKALSVTVPTVYKYRTAVESWNVGDPWPPSEATPADAVQPRPMIALVKS